jgi:hypothetical protein
MPKLTRDHARAQAARLQANPILAPQSDAGRTELIDCLMRNCQSSEHCAAAMTALLDGSIEFPREMETTTARLAFCARRLQIAETAPAGCDRCYLGPDVTTGEIRWYAHVPGERNGYTYAARCDCERGKWLAARDRERLATEARGDRKPVARHEHAADADWQKRAAGDE